MKLVVFGLSVSSSWGNGHATLWRGLCGALSRRGHQVVFFERDVPYYAAHRDLEELRSGRLVLYPDWGEVREQAVRELAGADVAMVTSYCPDAVLATALVLDSSARVKAFYDLDTPVTLERLRAGERVEYVAEEGLGEFDLVLSYTGGAALDELRSALHARRVHVLYGSVDPGVHKPVPAVDDYRADLSYLGTYAEDRLSSLCELFVIPAQRLPQQRFLIGGAQYPHDFPWTRNTFFVRHVPPPLHAAFYCSSRATLNVTRKAMAQMGYCPSGRLFEAAACGTPIISDGWAGLETFFEPGREIVVARGADDVIAALELGEAELQSIGVRARERVLSEHAADHRALELERILESVLAQGAAAGASEPASDNGAGVRAEM